MYMFCKKVRIVLLAGVMLAIHSCKEDELLPPANTNAYISFINASPFLGNDGRGDATAVRVSVQTNNRANANDLLVTYNTIYPQPNKYVPFSEGNTTIAFKDSVHTPLTTGSINTQAKAYYSAILADSMNTYSAMIVADDYDPVPGKALVRVMHFCPDGGEVTLYRDTTKLENFGVMHYKQVTPYTPVEPGSNFSFIIRKNDGTSQRVARYFTTSLVAGAAYTILLKGYVEPPDGDIGNKKSQIVFYRN